MHFLLLLTQARPHVHPGAIKATPAHAASCEGIIITAIICVTILLLALIFKDLLIKFNEQKQKSGQSGNGGIPEQTVRLQKKHALVEKLLAFEENQVKNATDQEKENAANRYRETINGFIAELSDQKENG